MAKKSASPRVQHMAKRKTAGVPYTGLAKEFATSKSSAHRAIKASGVLRAGFNRLGSAK